jgi:hypothetical protein
MSLGLSVDDVVKVDVTLSPLPSTYRNFGVAVIVGATDTINIIERYRQYTDMSGVGGDFSTTDPEYLAAQLFFSQQPQPDLLLIGRWAKTATNAQLNGAIFSAAQQATLLGSLQAITNGSIKFTIDGVVRNVSALNFSTATNLNAVAATINAGLTGGSVAWQPDSNARFVVSSATSGTPSTMGYADTTGARHQSFRTPWPYPGNGRRGSCTGRSLRKPLYRRAGLLPMRPALMAWCSLIHRSPITSICRLPPSLKPPARR